MHRDLREKATDHRTRDVNEVLLSSRCPPFDIRVFKVRLKVQNICIASPLPSPNNFNPPFSSPSAWLVTPTIPTFVPIRLSFKACPTQMKKQTLGFKTSLHVYTVLKSVKKQVYYRTSAISTNMDIQTYFATSGLDPSIQSTLIHGHDEGAGISHTDNIRLPVCWFLIMPGHLI